MRYRPHAEYNNQPYPIRSNEKGEGQKESVPKREVALAKNYILESRVQHFEGIPRYWTSGGQEEVDVLIQHENEVIPIVVKADKNVRSRSPTRYRKKFSPELTIRFSLWNMNFDNGLVNIPLFMADDTQKIIATSKRMRL